LGEPLCAFADFRRGGVAIIFLWRPGTLGAFFVPISLPVESHQMFDTTTRTIVIVGAQWGDEGKG